MILESENLLRAEFKRSVECLSCFLSEDYGGHTLMGVGLVTSDDMTGVAAWLLFDGDMPSEPYPGARFSPVEWQVSQAECFQGLNRLLTPLGERNWQGEYAEFVRRVFEIGADAVEEADFRSLHGDHVFLTFVGVDPSPILEEEEERFVKRLNPAEVYGQWRATVYGQSDGGSGV